MNLATRAALYNALLFPGWGEIYLKRYKRGVLILTGVTAGIISIVWSIGQTTISILKISPFKKGTVTFVAVAQLAVDAIKALNLFYLCELNMARPYTYSESAPIISYSNANSPLAHPLGANFREGVAHLDAVFGRYVFSVHCNYAVYGKDSSTISYGGNPLNSYENRNANYGISLFQGVRTTLSVVDARVQYILNSRSYLRVEAGVISRIESSALNDENSLWFFVGLRSSLRTIYLDY